MNRFFTLLLAASCLTAVGQTDYVPDSVLIDEGWSLVLEREGQQYWLFNEDREWEDARAMCEELGAYLYWPNSLEEHLDVWASVPSGDDGIHYWTAVHQNFNIVDCSDPHGGWAGPNEVPQQFFHWSAENPNNATGRESVVQFEYGDWGALWNDAPGQACDDGFNCTCRFSRVILERSDNLGCTDPLACNFEGQSLIEDGSCDYSCCPGPGCCGEGTTWNWQTSECDVTNPSDSNFDGCVQLNDLLDLLSAYGDCGAEESLWQCGDPLEYQGYDYETVQIGEQCWFAENLRTQIYSNGSEVGSLVAGESWLSLTYGATIIYGDGDDCQSAASFNSCNVEVSLSEYGRLYNWFAVTDERGLCPSGWVVPTDEDWMILETLLGLSPSEIDSIGWRGYTQAIALKSTSSWPNEGGENGTGFTAISGGLYSGVQFTGAGEYSHWWSSSVSELDASRAWRRTLTDANQSVGRNHSLHTAGFYVRCIKDAE